MPGSVPLGTQAGVAGERLELSQNGHQHPTPKPPQADDVTA